MEEPKVSMILELAHEQGLNFKLEEASYYLGRGKLFISSDPAATFSVMPWKYLPKRSSIMKCEFLP